MTIGLHSLNRIDEYSIWDSIFFYNSYSNWKLYILLVY